MAERRKGVKGARTYRSSWQRPGSCHEGKGRGEIEQAGRCSRKAALGVQKRSENLPRLPATVEGNTLDPRLQ